MKTLLVLFVLPLLLACTKKMPTKKNDIPHMRCVMNGAEWRAETPVEIPNTANFMVEYIDSLGYLSLKGTKKNETETTWNNLYIFAYGVHGVGTVTIYTGDEGITGFADVTGNYPCGVYDHDPAHPGQLTITKWDTVTGIVRGTFQMVLKNPACGADSLMHVTDGTFAFKYPF